MNLFNQNYHIQIHMLKLQHEKKKKKKMKRDSMEREILVNIYKFWNFDNRYLVGVGFKFQKLRCMLHVLLKHLLLLW